MVIVEGYSWVPIREPSTRWALRSTGNAQSSLSHALPRGTLHGGASVKFPAWGPILLPPVDTSNPDRFLFPLS